MFGGTQICPRCSNAVYAAEQVMGPGRKFYHKPCLACTDCNKRLDSYTLFEHYEQPYCKSCHLKNFGTPNLRHANLPTSPGGSPKGKRSTSPSSTLPLRPINTGTPVGPSSPTYGNGNGTTFLKLKPNRSLSSPTSATFPRSSANPVSPTYNGNSNGFTLGNDDRSGMIIEEYEPDNSEDLQADIETEQLDADEPATSSLTNVTYGNLTNTGRPGIGTIPRTVPLRHMSSKSVDVPTAANVVSANSTGTSAPSTSYAYSQTRSPTSPVLSSFATGTRYGIALTGGVPSHSTGGIGVNCTGGILLSPTGGSPRKWGTGTPTCPRCGKSVYFAEQAKAAGKAYHKTCLRCLDCGTSLDSHKLRDHDGQPYCVRCYQKAYGPQGNGYALLGKAGG